MLGKSPHGCIIRDRCLQRRCQTNEGECHDMLATNEELKAKGVGFTKPTPTKELYGYEALFKDDLGNWFSRDKNRQTAKKPVHRLTERERSS